MKTGGGGGGGGVCGGGGGVITNDGFLESSLLYNARCIMYAGETMHCKPCYKDRFVYRYSFVIFSPKLRNTELVQLSYYHRSG